MNADQIRQLLDPLLSREKVHFTVYRKHQKNIFGGQKHSFPARAWKCKGTITAIWCTREGIKFHFDKCYINRKLMPIECAFLLKDIRWKQIPVDWDKISALLFKRLESGQKAVSGYAAINRDL